MKLSIPVIRSVGEGHFIVYNFRRVNIDVKTITNNGEGVREPDWQL